MDARKHAAPRSTHWYRSTSTSRPARTQDARPLHWLVRCGFLARAVVYAVIAALALALALGIGIRSASASPQGALALIVAAPLGRLALVIISAALLAYAVWKLVQCVRGSGPEGGGGTHPQHRLANLGGGVVYLVFFAVSIAVLTGSAGNGSGETKETAAHLLGLPGGEVLLGAAGVGLLLISAYQAYDAISGKFATDNKIEQMSLAGWRAFMLIGRVGLQVRAIIFGFVGYFLLRAAIELHAREAVGVDGALAAVHREPFGSWLLALVAGGLFTFAAFSALEGRYRRL